MTFIISILVAVIRKLLNVNESLWNFTSILQSKCVISTKKYNNIVFIIARQSLQTNAKWVISFYVVGVSDSNGLTDAKLNYEITF